MPVFASVCVSRYYSLKMQGRLAGQRESVIRGVMQYKADQLVDQNAFSTTCARNVGETARDVRGDSESP